jgi:hypothetical protein
MGGFGDSFRSEFRLEEQGRAGLLLAMWHKFMEVVAGWMAEICWEMGACQAQID